MRVLSLNELLRLTRLERCDLLVQMTNVLRIYPEGSNEHQSALTNIRNIVRVLVGREMAHS